LRPPCPAVAQVEYVQEPFARLQPRQFDALIVLGDFALDLLVPVRPAQPGLAGEGELLQVGSVPSGEGVVDSVGELPESVAARRREYPPGKPTCRFAGYARS
jgi:hypothetical protein